MRLAQLDRAFGYGPKGRGFESSSARFFMHKYMSEISRMHFSVQPDEIGMMAEMLINEVFSFFSFHGISLRKWYLAVFSKRQIVTKSYNAGRVFM